MEPTLSGLITCDGGPLFGAAESAAAQPMSAARVLREALQCHGYSASSAAKRCATRSAAGGPPGADEYFERRYGGATEHLAHDGQGVLFLLFLVGRAVSETTVEAAHRRDMIRSL